MRGVCKLLESGSGERQKADYEYEYGYEGKKPIRTGSRLKTKAGVCCLVVIGFVPS